MSEFSGQGVGFKRSRRRFAPAYASNEASYNIVKRGTKNADMTARDLTDELLDKLTVIYMRGTLRGKCEGCPETRKTITLVLAK